MDAHTGSMHDFQQCSQAALHSARANCSSFPTGHTAFGHVILCQSGASTHRRRAAHLLLQGLQSRAGLVPLPHRFLLPRKPRSRLRTQWIYTFHHSSHKTLLLLLCVLKLTWSYCLQVCLLVSAASVVQVPTQNPNLVTALRGCGTLPLRRGAASCAAAGRTSRAPRPPCARTLPAERVQAGLELCSRHSKSQCTSLFNANRAKRRGLSACLQLHEVPPQLIVPRRRPRQKLVCVVILGCTHMHTSFVTSRNVQRVKGLAPVPD